ncbi:MAG: hypothetical protein ACR2HJ_01700, partial [Fimbriimonadales bacterium]
RLRLESKARAEALKSMPQPPYCLHKQFLMKAFMAEGNVSEEWAAFGIEDARLFDGDEYYTDEEFTFLFGEDGQKPLR